MNSSAKDITTLLELAADDQNAKEQLFKLVQERFRKIAGAKMQNERANHTLQATALVVDAFVRLVNGKPYPWKNREQFFCAAAKTMRRLLVEHARSKLAIRRSENPVGLDDAREVADRKMGNPEYVVALDEALDRLEAVDSDAFKVFDMHYFGGWPLTEIAEDILVCSYTTVKRHWNFAKAFLRQELAGETANDE